MKMPFPFLGLLLILGAGFVPSSFAEPPKPQKLLSAPPKLPRKPINDEEKRVFSELIGSPKWAPPRNYLNPPVGKLSAQVKSAESYYNGVMNKLLAQKPFDSEMVIKINF